MSIQKIAKLVEKLDNLTSQGQIEWEQTERDDVYQTSFPNFSVRIYRVIDDIEIGIYNSQGMLLESATDIELSQHIENSYLRMKSIYDSARGYALGAEKALDEILKELDQKDLPF